MYVVLIGRKLDGDKAEILEWFFPTLNDVVVFAKDSEIVERSWLSVVFIIYIFFPTTSRLNLRMINDAVIFDGVDIIESSTKEIIKNDRNKNLTETPLLRLVTTKLRCPHIPNHLGNIWSNYFPLNRPVISRE